MKINSGPEFRNYQSFAVALAKKAGNLLYYNFNKAKKIKEKAFGEFVTHIDRQSEKIIVSAIKKTFPGHAILTEEGRGVKKKSDFLWLIDPLDGTHNYIAQIPIYGISITLSFKGKIIMGVIYLPHLKELYTARISNGAYGNGKRIQVSKKKLLKESFLIQEGAFHERWSEKLRTLRFVSKKAKRLRILGSICFESVYVAAGRIEGFLSQGGKPWDFAAGTIIIQEAGGKVTNLKGENYTVKDRYVIASNGKIHEQLLRLLKH